MNERKTEKRKAAWGILCFGVLMVGVGAIIILQGVTAYKTGAIIPATTKSGPMTGLQSVVAGIIATVVGLSFIGNAIYQELKGIKHVFEVVVTSGRWSLR